MPIVANGKTEYTDWNAQLTNVLARVIKLPNGQAIPRGRELLREILRSCTHPDKAEWKDAEVHVKVKNDLDLTVIKFAEDKDMDPSEVTRALMNANEDLDFILTSKTSGEAAVKVKDSEGDGWIALYRVHRWHTTVTQHLLQEELKKATHPQPITRDDTIVDRLIGWSLNG